MSLHRLSHVTIGVPNVEETAAYYEEFGLAAARVRGSPPPTAASNSGSSTNPSAVWSTSASLPTTPTTSTVPPRP